MSQIAFGAKFSSYDAIQEAVSNYEEEHFVKFYKKDARKLDVGRSRKKVSIAPPELQYYMIQYCCIRGGKMHKKRIFTGTRKTMTWRQGCPALITFTLSKDAQSLEVTAINEIHNHEISPELYRSLPMNRRLSPSSQEMVMRYFRIGAKIRTIRDQMRKETGKLVTVKDINNIITKYTKAKPFGEVASEEIVCSLPEFSTSEDAFIETSAATETLNAIENTPGQLTEMIKIKEEAVSNLDPTKRNLLNLNLEKRKNIELSMGISPSAGRVKAIAKASQTVDSSKEEMSVMETQRKILKALEFQNTLLQKNVENQRTLINLETEKNDKLDTVIKNINTLLAVMVQAHNIEIVTI